MESPHECTCGLRDIMVTGVPGSHYGHGAELYPVGADILPGTLTTAKDETRLHPHKPNSMSTTQLDYNGQVSQQGLSGRRSYPTGGTRTYTPQSGAWEPALTASPAQAQRRPPPTSAQLAWANSPAPQDANSFSEVRAAVSSTVEERLKTLLKSSPAKPSHHQGVANPGYKHLDDGELLHPLPRSSLNSGARYGSSDLGDEDLYNPSYVPSTPGSRPQSYSRGQAILNQTPSTPTPQRPGSTYSHYYTAAMPGQPPTPPRYQPPPHYNPRGPSEPVGQPNPAFQTSPQATPRVPSNGHRDLRSACNRLYGSEANSRQPSTPQGKSSQPGGGYNQWPVAAPRPSRSSPMGQSASSHSPNSPSSGGGKTADSKTVPRPPPPRPSARDPQFAESVTRSKHEPTMGEPRPAVQGQPKDEHNGDRFEVPPPLPQRDNLSQHNKHTRTVDTNMNMTGRRTPTVTSSHFTYGQSTSKSWDSQMMAQAASGNSLPRSHSSTADRLPERPHSRAALEHPLTLPRDANTIELQPLSVSKPPKGPERGSASELATQMSQLTLAQAHWASNPMSNGRSLAIGQYSPSEASSRSVTPPLPPLSPSNTPPITPPASPPHTARGKPSIHPSYMGHTPDVVNSAKGRSAGKKKGLSGFYDGLSGMVRRKKPTPSKMLARPRTARGYKHSHSMNSLDNVSDSPESGDAGSSTNGSLVDTADSLMDGGSAVHEVSAIRRQLEGLEGMYGEILRVLGLDAQMVPGSRRSISSLSSVSRTGRGSRSRRLGSRQRPKESSKQVSKRFARLESHVVTLARSVAHLSSEMRQHNVVYGELESLKRELQTLKDQQATRAGPKMYHDDWDRFRGWVPSLTNPRRVNKLTKFFGEEPPFLHIFLKKLGYERYITNFDQEKISMIELPYMNEDRLQKIGIPMGPRLRIIQEAQMCFRQENFDIYIV